VEDVRKLAQVFALFVGGGIVISLVLFVGQTILYYTFPEWIGPHHEFYRTCKSIGTGSTIEEARDAMKGYLEVGRTWQPPAQLPAGIFGATVQGVGESRVEHESRILFIPDGKNLADWCLVYPERGRVARVEVSPD